jgi:hypothetical protein
MEDRAAVEQLDSRFAVDLLAVDRTEGGSARQDVARLPEPEFAAEL